MLDLDPTGKEESEKKSSPLSQHMQIDVDHVSHAYDKEKQQRTINGDFTLGPAVKVSIIIVVLKNYKYHVNSTWIFYHHAAKKIIFYMTVCICF